jgi:hypothetical protein
MRVITQGENCIIRRNLKRADKTPLQLAETSLLKAEIIQDGTVLETLTYPVAKLRQGQTSSQAELEVTTDVTNKFRKGKVSVRWEIRINNAEFDVENFQSDKITEVVFDVR